eukprot:SAG31_NODE_30918_length_374_cov_1.301818_1_plen_95_part_00
MDSYHIYLNDAVPARTSGPVLEYIGSEAKFKFKFKCSIAVYRSRTSSQVRYLGTGTRVCGNPSDDNLDRPPCMFDRETVSHIPHPPPGHSKLLL